MTPLMKTILWVIVIWLVSGWIAGDEALMISGGGSAQLVFLDRGQTVANNLGAPPASIFRASPQGRLAMLTMAGEWRLVSPFRNLPYNQWPPFKVAELPTRYKSIDAPEPLQWAPDGRKFLIRLNRTITIHHAGGGPLMTITNTPDVSGAWAANMQWGNDSNHLILFHVDSRSYYLVGLPDRGSLTWDELERGNAVRFFQLNTTSSSTVDRFHFSPDGRQVAFVHASGAGAELWAGLLERPGRVDHDAARNESGWNTPRTEYTRLEETPELLPLGWSQDSRRFYYYSARRTERVVSDGSLRETAHQEQLVRHELKVYDVSAGRAWTVMALNWSPWLPYEKGYPQPNVSADGRHLVFWGVDNIRYQSPTTLPIHTDMLKRTMNEVDLVVVDLAAKTTRTIARKRFQDVPWAAFIKTQEGDGTNPQPAHKEPRPRLPQYFLDIKPTPAPERFCSIRALRLPFEGKALGLPQQRTKLMVRATFSQNGAPLKDRDSQFRTNDGRVANFFPLSHSAMSVEGDHFTGTMYVPLNDLDHLSDQAAAFTVHLELLEGERTLVEARPVSVTIPAEWMPRVWFTKIAAQIAADGAGNPAIRVRAEVVVRHMAGREVRIETTVLDKDYQDVGVRDPRFRVTGNRAGAAAEIRPAGSEERHSVDVSIPLAGLQLAAGRHDLVIVLRAMTGRDQALGESRPQPVAVTIGN
ncbi:MAG TPA: hypothetical protein PK176_12630 [Acidobacteriota bacterium]|nr:hypothetical protein [Acidobacteriota bacterium]HQM64151.1 hypothetical protein [Acidobacteriota bacterium]